MKIITILCMLIVAPCAFAKMKVATLSPLLADLARQVGGDQVEVVDLMGPNGDPHTFRPSPSALQEANGAKIYLVNGKNLEPFLPNLKSIVGNKATILEVGRKIPSLTISSEGSLYACCPKHSHGALDPHWWQSIDNWRRATSIVADEFAELDPSNKDHYKANAKAYRSQLSSTKTWAKKQIAGIPRDQRHLATAHAAYGYFCKEFGFKSIPVQGLNKEQSATPQYVAEAVATIRSNKVKAIFPEKMANTKSIQSIAKESGAKVGDSLYADSHNSIIGMFQHNVNSIVKALR
ncbi:manganese-binding lipoprotein MntA [Rubritalea halochordaticola]|uniref:Manganese-binding lipoprotein MntA n=1 Tax=Rubritalea halochordaticola TaxID=714537 RepID=A0ABP9V2V2_9BACT